MARSRKPAGLAEAPLFASLTPDVALSSAPGADGHRLRMRQRLLKAGPDALADHEMLEMTLFIALPRRDTKPIARDMLARFGSFSAVVGAPVPELLGVEGVGEAGAAAIKLIQAAALRLMRHQVTEKPILTVWSDLLAYLQAAMRDERVEQFRVLFLDARNRLIADEVQVKGTIDRTAAYPREVVRRCLELHATGIVLAHNHPSGEVAPSRDDLATTADIVRAAAALGIQVVDHIIVGKGKWLSLRQERMM